MDRRRRRRQRLRRNLPRPVVRERLTTGRTYGRRVDNYPRDPGGVVGHEGVVDLGLGVDPYQQVKILIVLAMCYAFTSLFLLILGIVLQVTGVIIAGGVSLLFCLAAILTLSVIWRNKKLREIHGSSERRNDREAGDEGSLVAHPRIRSERTAHGHAAMITDGRMQQFGMVHPVRETSQCNEYLEPVRYVLPQRIGGVNQANFTRGLEPNVPHPTPVIHGPIETSRDQVHVVTTRNMLLCTEMELNNGRSWVNISSVKYPIRSTRI